MAESVVGLLIGKLGTALAAGVATYGASIVSKEASDLKGLFRGIHKAKEELECMEAFLHDSEKFKDTDNTTGIFVKKIRDLAFQIEDVVDEFMYKLEDDKHVGFSGNLKKRARHVTIWRRLTLELCSINEELEEATKRRARYTMPKWSEHHCVSSSNMTTCFAREEDLVGIEDNVDKLKGWLIGDLDKKKNKITTVWGMGGAGKTTLVDQVYKIVKLDFDTGAWVTVSKIYQVDDLLKRIAREFGISVDATNMEIIRLVEVIRNYLEGKRYILVLDDVWERCVWINIMDVFPANCTGRFVLASRNYEVASLATHNCAIKLEPLENDQSWKLFCNVAFRNTDDKRCPLELQDLAVKFLQKCEGLPLAIACIGRLLSCKLPTYPAWKNFYDDLELHSTGAVIPSINIILKVSLEDLPYELKNCFLHCAIFPEDYVMKRRRLIRHWITAGFIKNKDNKTLEQVAEGYLNELVNRSLLKVVKKNEFGRVKYCQMHDIIRHLALEKAKIECFGKVYEGSRTFCFDGTRRLSIHSTNVAPLSKSCATRLRAIHAFTSHVDIDVLRSMVSSSTLLSTLDLEGTQIAMLPNEVFNLFNLRFLSIRHTRIVNLPEAIGRLQNLEVLDTWGTAVLSLPKEVSKLRKLRYLYASTALTERCITLHIGIKVPRGIRYLTGLHVLQDVKASLESLCDVAALTELRTFAVSDVTTEHSSNLCSAVVNMKHLVHLSISALNENGVLPLEALHLPETLSKLELVGQLEKKFMPQIPSSWSHLKNLTRLNLRSSKLDEDLFPSLMSLHALCYLYISNAYEGKKLCFSSESFPRLRLLHISEAPRLNQVEIEEGALSSLVELHFLFCPKLKKLPHGIQYLTALEILSLKDTAQELIEKLRWEREANEFNEERVKISHIRKVVVQLPKTNIWERIR